MSRTRRRILKSVELEAVQSKLGGLPTVQPFYATDDDANITIYCLMPQPESVHADFFEDALHILVLTYARRGTSYAPAVAKVRSLANERKEVVVSALLTVAQIRRESGRGC